jgi:hypothetical protein
MVSAARRCVFSAAGRSAATGTWLEQPCIALRTDFFRFRPTEGFRMDLKQTTASRGRADESQDQTEQNRQLSWREHPEISTWK